MSNYVPPVNSIPNYMSSWGNYSTPAQQTANKIDHIADKAHFALEMLDTVIQGMDALEKELVEMSNLPHPPNSHMIRSIAHRMDAQQQQLKQVTHHVKHFMGDIDRATDVIQTNRASW